MMRRVITFAIAPLAAVSLLAASAAAQPPRIINGKVVTHSAASPLAASFRSLVGEQADVAWIGFAVPAVEGRRSTCCSDSGDGVYINGSGQYYGACRIEPGSESSPSPKAAAAPAGPVRLESGERVVVLFRVSSKAVERIRTVSDDCELDAGGRTVTWLDGVKPAESVALLESFVTPADGRTDRIMDGAVTAIALTGDPSADTVLDRFSASAQPESLRRKVMFWLGNARGAHGLARLQQVLKTDPSVEVRKAAVFGVSQSREASAFDTLSGLARADADVKVRSEAVFWIAQRGGDRASSVILDALEKDPSPEVRKKAVFALSQLKNDAGVDALIRTAKTSADAQVRSEAIFWLGQKAGKVAAAAITDRIDNDPNTEVKKKAVFALSQMPASEGVPLLINAARTNANPEVRKQAIFWLGQSKDPKALAFFEEVLLRK